MLEKLENALQQRYCTKVFKQNATIDNSKLDTLLNTLTLAPTSINSQAWHLYIISDPIEKARLATASWPSNQGKYKDGAYLFIFCAKTTFSEKDLLELETLTAEIRGVPVNQERMTMLTNYLASMPDEECQEWLIRQVYIVLGQFLTSCALLDIDSCPIEGFDKKAMDELLRLKEKGLTSVVSAVIGERDHEDFNTLEKAAKIRFSREKMITEIK
jgi:nitroreductase/dihydropteridine reductase